MTIRERRGEAMTVKPEDLKVGQIVRVYYWHSAPSRRRIFYLLIDTIQKWAIHGSHVTKKGLPWGAGRVCWIDINNVLEIVKQSEEGSK